MANPWLRLYTEFATDPKVQMMSESMQRRLVMLFCAKSDGVLDDETLRVTTDETLQETGNETLDVTELENRLCFLLRISSDELAKTKTEFLKMGFINDSWQLPSWLKRQYTSDSSTSRVRKYRENLKRKGNVTVTPPDTDTDTDTELDICEAKTKKDSDQEKFKVIVEIFNDVFSDCSGIRKVDLSAKATNKRRMAKIKPAWAFASKRVKDRVSQGLEPVADRDAVLRWFRNYFVLCLDDPWINGSTREGQPLDFDYILRDTTLEKNVLEPKQ